MLNEQIAQLIARHLAGESSETEKKQLEVILKQDPEARYFYEMFSGYWSNMPKKEFNQLQDEIHFQQIIAIAEKEKSEAMEVREFAMQNIQTRSFTLFKKLSIAAVVAALVISSYFLFFQTKTSTVKPVAQNVVEANKGTRSNILLPDGTNVWLNSDSKLEYSGDFSQSREVKLIGEAYFEVTRDPAHPFVVHTSDIDIRVLGTAFNVKSYPKEEIIETTLIHGLIEISNVKQPGSKMILHPHDKLVFHKHNNQPDAGTNDKSISTNNVFSIAKIPLKISDTDRVETSWIYNKLVFDGETFKEAAAKMERWYNVSITFKSEKAANFQLHYAIETETIEEALKYMKESGFKFDYQMHGNEIEIY